MMGEGEEEVHEQPPVQTSTDELEGGIFNMIIALCQLYATSVPMPQAKEHVALWLERIVNGLRATDQEK